MAQKKKKVTRKKSIKTQYQPAELQGALMKALADRNENLETHIRGLHNLLNKMVIGMTKIIVDSEQELVALVDEFNAKNRK